MELYFCADSNTASPTDDKNLSCRLSADKSFYICWRGILLYMSIQRLRDLLLKKTLTVG